MRYTWKHGRQLASSSGVGGNWTYSYNADGMRYRRTNGSTTYTYYYNGDLLRYLDVDSNPNDTVNGTKLYFVLDATGKPIEVSYLPEGGVKDDTTFYYYVHNLQGDVEALVDSRNGIPVVWYTYDAWGNVLSIGGNMASTLGKLNPFRYRSYVYDEETELYYLQSRYYDPEMGRFINADAFATTGQGLLGNNTFAYCNNNPTNNIDSVGFMAVAILSHQNHFCNDRYSDFGVVSEQEDATVISGTVSLGIAISGSFGAFPYGVSICISTDLAGNSEIQWTYISGLTTGDAGFSATGYITMTNAPRVSNLHGLGYQVGGTYGVSLPAVGVDYNIIPDSNTGSMYHGYTFATGYATPEVHVLWGDTRPIRATSFNLFDYFNDLQVVMMGGQL